MWTQWTAGWRSSHSMENCFANKYFASETAWYWDRITPATRIDEFSTKWKSPFGEWVMVKLECLKLQASIWRFSSSNWFWSPSDSFNRRHKRCTAKLIVESSRLKTFPTSRIVADFQSKANRPIIARASLNFRDCRGTVSFWSRIKSGMTRNPVCLCDIPGLTRNPEVCSQTEIWNSGLRPE